MRRSLAVFIQGAQVVVPEQEHTYTPNKVTSDEVTPAGELVHREYDIYTEVPAVPPDGNLRIQQVETNATDIIAVFDRRTLEPKPKELFGSAFRWQKIISELEITDAEGPGNSYPTGTLVKKFTGAYRYAPNNGILWYFSNLGLFFLVGHLADSKIKAYLDTYVANLNNNYAANDVYANPDATLKVNTTTGDPSPVRPPDSHDSYAATFLMLAVRYLRHTHDWDWLDGVNTRFNETNLQTLLNIASYNITSQIKTAAWCNTNGFSVDYPNGRNTLLVNTFQNGQNPAGGAYDISFTADNCECYRGLKDFGELLEDIGDTNASSILQHAENIGIAVHGLYDVNRRKWVWNDSLKSSGGFVVWFDTNPDNWQADATNVGAALYPDVFGGVFAELWAVPSTGGDQVDSLRYNDGWEFLNIAAPGWYERADYDSFPNNFCGYLAAARRRDYTKAAKALDKFLKYYLNVQGPQFPAQATLSGNTSGFSLLSEVGFGIGIQDTVTIAMAGHIEGSSYPYTPFTAKKLRALQYVEKPLRKQLLTAATSIKPNAAFLPIGATGDVTITATPSIETTAEDGSKITLVNLDDVFVELQDESLLAGSKLRLGVPRLRLNQYDLNPAHFERRKVIAMPE